MVLESDKDMEFSTYGDKLKGSKYKRWTPEMDKLLIKLLHDIVHSFAKDDHPQMTKRSWHYISNELRAANPQTVYSTFTKYSCQQHLYNVIHARYRMWCVLLMFSKKNRNDSNGYSYKWNPNLGNFQIIDETRDQVIVDTTIIKSIMYSNRLSLPNLSQFHKGNIVVNDFFLSDTFSFISEYHNEILPMMIKLDPRYSIGLENVYNDIPRFDYDGFKKPYMVPLHPKNAKPKALRKSKPADHVLVKLPEESNSSNILIQSPQQSPDQSMAPQTHQNLQISQSHNSPTQASQIHSNPPQQTTPAIPQLVHIPRNSIDTHNPETPVHQRMGDEMYYNPNVNRIPVNNLTQQQLSQFYQQQYMLQQLTHQQIQYNQMHQDEDKRRDIEYENDLNYQVQPLQQPSIPQATAENYAKDRKWFTKLIFLQEKNLLSINEVLTICEGVRDGKIPLAMLNILDPGYNREEQAESELKDEEMSRRVRDYMLPMTYMRL